MAGSFNPHSWSGLARKRRTTGEPPRTARREPSNLSPGARSLGWAAGLLPNTIDRYVLFSFLKNYLLSFFVLIGLYCVLDMVFNFDEFVEVTGHEGVDDVAGAFEVLFAIGKYYFFQSFRVFSYLAGIIPVMAAAFTLMRMSRFNELAALLAAGVPLLRVAQPIIIASVVLNLILLPLNQELIVPRLLPAIAQERGSNTSFDDGKPLQAMPDGDTALVFAGQYLPGDSAVPSQMKVVDVVQRIDNQITLITADVATWDPANQKWNLVNGLSTPILRPGETGRAAVAIDSFQGTTSPESITLFRSRGDFVDLLSTGRINQLLSARNPVGRIDLLRVRDARLAGFVLNIILVLLTIPCVLTREPTLLRTATGRAFALVGSCMAMIFITQNLAGRPPDDLFWASKWSGLMAWLPIFIFGPVAVWLLDRIRS
jgi:lipopolysaccharide export system permease protein